MRFAKFWKMQALELSLTERMFFRDAIRTLQAWEIIRKEYAELDLVKKILEAEINVSLADSLEVKTAKKREDFRKQRVAL